MVRSGGVALVNISLELGLELLEVGLEILYLVIAQVLDEADRLLDGGFERDVESVMHSPGGRARTMCLSATMPPSLARFLQRQLPPDHAVIDVFGGGRRGEHLLLFSLRGGGVLLSLCLSLGGGGGSLLLSFCLGGSLLLLSLGLRRGFSLGLLRSLGPGAASRSRAGRPQVGAGPLTASSLLCCKTALATAQLGFLQQRGLERYERST